MKDKYPHLDIDMLKNKYMYHYKSHSVVITDHQANFEKWCIEDSMNQGSEEVLKSQKTILYCPNHPLKSKEVNADDTNFHLCDECQDQMLRWYEIIAKKRFDPRRGKSKNLNKSES